MKDLVILNLNKAVHFNMARAENDLDIYYAVGNANTQRQESEIATIINTVSYTHLTLPTIYSV